MSSVGSSPEQFLRFPLLGGGEAMIHAWHVREIATNPRADAGTRVTAMIGGTLREYTTTVEGSELQDRLCAALDSLGSP